MKKPYRGYNLKAKGRFGCFIHSNGTKSILFMSEETSTIPQSAATESAVLDRFVSDMLKERGVDSLPKEVQDQMHEDLMARVNDRINAAVLAAMSPTHVEEFEKVVDSGNVEAIQKFCSDHVPGIDEIVAHELILLKSSYLSA